MLSYRSYDGTLTVGGGKGSPGTVVDAATGAIQPGPSALAKTLSTMQRMHQTLLLDLGWLVTASTVAMLAMIVLGVLMGWPRFSNTVSGWHKGTAWVLLPLIALSPLTGLMLALRIGGAPPAQPPQAQGAAIALSEAVRIVGKEHDLSSLVWIRSMGGRTLVLLAENREYTAYAVGRDGTQAMPRSWPRLWHEGNFAGAWSALMNLIISVAMLGLLGTGLWIWLRRQLRRRARRAKQPVAA
jgi:uncharacterized iron-regulated membrane protein